MQLRAVLRLLRRIGTVLHLLRDMDDESCHQMNAKPGLRSKKSKTRRKLNAFSCILALAFYAGLIALTLSAGEPVI